MIFLLLAFFSFAKLSEVRYAFALKRIRRACVVKTEEQIDFLGCSDIGKVRKQNEDAWGHIAEKGVFVLADGMGGHRGGEVAAQMAVEHFCKRVKSADLLDETKLRHFVCQTVEDVNHVIYEKGQREPALRGMGTTLCVLWVMASRVIATHVGDSRIYRFRKDRLELLTEDHTLYNELLSLGTLSGQGAEDYPYKHILTQALGIHGAVHPTIDEFALEKRDLFLICSDGLTNFVSNLEIESLLAEKSSLKIRGKKLIDLANAHGGGDNITLILIQT